MTLLRLEKILLFLTLFFLPTQLGKHLWPEFSFIYSLPVDYLSPTIYFWDLLAIALILVRIFQNQRVNSTALNMFLFFIFSQTLSLLPIFDRPFIVNVGAGLVRAQQYLISGLFGVYLASSLFDFKKIFFWSIGISITLQSIIAILQFIKGGTLGLWILGERAFSISTPAIAKFDYQGLEFLRPYATFPHPNVLAGFLVVIIPILYLFALTKKQRKFFLIASFISFSSVLLTVSRTALLIAISFLLLTLKKRFISIALFSLVLISPILYTRFSAIFSFDNLSLLRRNELAEVSMEIFLKSPFLGAGLNNFIPAGANTLLIGPSRFLQPAHNIFILSLAETGIIGFLGLVFFLSLPLSRLIKFSHLDFQTKILLFVWGSLIFLGLFDHYLLTLPQGYRLLFLVWGLTLALIKKS